jgi:hypothetical protein
MCSPPFVGVKDVDETPLTGSVRPLLRVPTIRNDVNNSPGPGGDSRFRDDLQDNEGSSRADRVSGEDEVKHRFAGRQNLRSA